jgi:RNA polymerase sigma-70 factor (ECF subfamily)
MFGSRSVAKGALEPGARPDVSDDVRLLALVSAGDLHAFEELYRAYHPRLKRFLANMLRRPHLVDEVLNDTMMVVWRQPEKYNGKSKVSTWIYAIAYRKALKALRRRDEPIEDKSADARPCADPGPEQNVGQRQLQTLLLRAMGELSADHRAVVDLTYFHEIGYREIAELMDCPVDTVKTRMFHARRRLKAMLPGELADWL